MLRGMSISQLWNVVMLRMTLKLRCTYHICNTISSEAPYWGEKNVCFEMLKITASSECTKLADFHSIGYVNTQKN